MKAILALAFAGLGLVSGQLSGAQVITPEDYPVFGPNAPNNPPFCGYAYSSLNLNQITAVQGLDSSDCGTCIQVCGNGNCGYALVVDQGGEGLDLSTGLFSQLFGQSQTPEYATWNQVSDSNCDGIMN